jgi:DNA (cytosine-5)-methyltransferase 1
MKVLGLFSGIGGFELGLRNAGMEIKGLCEIEEHCNAVLGKQFPEAEHFLDVTKLNLPVGYADVICGGFPCTDISIAGKNNGGINGEKSGLWKEYKRVINEVRPKYAIIENVSAILGRGLSTVLQDLAQIGYDATYTMLDSKYFGVPQRRRRVYIIAVRDGIPADTEIFKFERRSTDEHRREVESFDKSFVWDFTESKDCAAPFAFFTRQRSNQFVGCGLSSTLAKRDHKSYTDLVLRDGTIRRVIPEERLSLQGFPTDWWDDCGLTNTQKFNCNGMTVPVTEYIGKRIMEFDNE